MIAEGDGFEEDRDAYLEDNVFFVPPSARWEFIKKSAKLSTIGQIIDEATLLPKLMSGEIRVPIEEADNL